MLKPLQISADFETVFSPRFLRQTHPAFRRLSAGSPSPAQSPGSSTWSRTYKRRL